MKEGTLYVQFMYVVYTYGHKTKLWKSNPTTECVDGQNDRRISVFPHNMSAAAYQRQTYRTFTTLTLDYLVGFRKTLWLGLNHYVDFYSHTGHQQQPPDWKYCASSTLLFFHFWPIWSFFWWGKAPDFGHTQTQQLSHSFIYSQGILESFTDTIESASVHNVGMLETNFKQHADQT